MQLSRIRNQIGSMMRLDESVGDLSTTIDEWINETYRRVANEANWPWLIKNDVIQTVADITTGTATISSGGTALTFSTGPTPSVANDYRIQFTTVSDDWYDITAHTAGATSATLSDAFLGTSDLTAGTYLLRKFWYSLPSDMDRLISVTEATSNTPIRYIDHRALKQIWPDVETTATAPTRFTMEGLDSSNNWRMRFFPVPQSTLNVDIWYYRTITDLSADTDSPILPSKWHEILIWGALAFYGYLFRDDIQRQKVAEDNYDKLLERMKAQLLPTTDDMTVIEPWDNRTPNIRQGLVPPVLPGDFGPNG